MSFQLKPILLGSSGVLTPFDYIVTLNGSTWTAQSQDRSFSNKTGTALHTVLNACYADHLTTGARILISYHGTVPIDAEITIGNPVSNRKFSLYGMGKRNTIVTANTNLASMIKSEKTGWDSPQQSDTLEVKDLTLHMNAKAQQAIAAPYTMLDVDARIIQDSRSGGSYVVGGGGSGGPTAPTNLSLEFNYVTNSKNLKLLDLWYDSVHIQNLRVACNINSATQDLFEFDGEHYTIDMLSLYIGASCVARNIFQCNGVYLHIGNVNLITSAPAATVGAFLKADAGPIVIGELVDGIPCTSLWADITTQTLVRRLENGSIEDVYCGTTGNLSSVATEYFTAFGFAGSSTSEAARKIQIRKACVLMNSYGILQAAPGAGTTRVITLRKNGGDTTHVLNFGAADVAANDTTHPILLAVGDVINWESDYTGVPASGNIHVASQINYL